MRTGFSTLIKGINMLFRSGTVVIPCFGHYQVYLYWSITWNPKIPWCINMALVQYHARTFCYFLLEHLENVWHVSVVSDFILFFKSWIYSDLIRAVQDLKENGRCLVPASLPPACLSLCYSDNRKARVIPTAANQSTPSENDKTCSLRSGLHWTVSGERNVFTLWMIWTAVLLCSCVSCHWPDRFPARPQHDERTTVCFMIPFVCSIPYFCLL